MSFLTYNFLVQRPSVDADGTLTLRKVAGSPLLGRFYYVPGGSGQRFENIPEIAKAQRAEVLSFADVKAPVRIGDLVTLPADLAAGAADGALRKIIQVRAYTFSLQCGLQRQPFTPLASWTAQSELSRTDPRTRKVTDLAFEASAPVLGYLEPAPDMVKAGVLGTLSERACYAFTLAPLARDTLLRDAAGAVWTAVAPSDVWPLPGDCRTLMREMLRVPPGLLAP